MKVCQSCRARFRGDAQICPIDGGKLVELPDPLIGLTLAGRFTIVTRIGAGGMGTVYRARHEAIGRDVAVKFLSPELAIDPTNRQRFLREAQAANRIGHEHIIEITDYGETDDGLVYLVMELLEGRPLSREIATGPLPPRRALNIALQIASALARAHELDVVHRDIKPDNIYLLKRGDRNDFVKILDFGLAHMKGELRLTATGTVFGTPEYMAPEQARGAPMTAAVDLYALGCVTFEMLTGELPFDGNTPDLILKHLREPPPAASSRLGGLPKHLDALVLKLMQKDPSRRHRDAYHLCEDLRTAIEQIPEDTVARMLPIASSAPAAAERLSEWKTISAEETWSDRVALFRKLLPRAHPRGDAPSWLVEAVTAVEAPVERLKQLRSELDRATSAAAEHEERTRDLRMRIGRALDELGRDESRVLRQHTEIAERMGEGDARLREMERPLLKAWCDVPAVPVSAARMVRDVAETLRDLGALAGVWLEVERSVALVRRDLQDRERERDDLRFQIAQLKGRLGSIDAEADMERARLRERSTKLDGEMQERLEEVVRGAGPIMRYFMQFPELRPIVLGEGAADPLETVGA